MRNHAGGGSWDPGCCPSLHTLGSHALNQAPLYDSSRFRCSEGSSTITTCRPSALNASASLALITLFPLHGCPQTTRRLIGIWLRMRSGDCAHACMGIDEGYRGLLGGSLARPVLKAAASKGYLKASLRGISS
jgi:hypothetical protein